MTRMCPAAGPTLGAAVATLALCSVLVGCTHKPQRQAQVLIYIDSSMSIRWRLKGLLGVVNAAVERVAGGAHGHVSSFDRACRSEYGGPVDDPQEDLTMLWGEILNRAPAKETGTLPEVALKDCLDRVRASDAPSIVIIITDGEGAWSEAFRKAALTLAAEKRVRGVLVLGTVVSPTDLRTPTEASLRPFGDRAVVSSAADAAQAIDRFAELAK